MSIFTTFWKKYHSPRPKYGIVLLTFIVINTNVTSEHKFLKFPLSISVYSIFIINKNLKKGKYKHTLNGNWSFIGNCLSSSMEKKTCEKEKCVKRKEFKASCQEKTKEAK